MQKPSIKLIKIETKNDKGKIKNYIELYLSIPILKYEEDGDYVLETPILPIAGHAKTEEEASINFQTSLTMWFESFLSKKNGTKDLNRALSTYKWVEIPPMRMDSICKKDQLESFQFTEKSLIPKKVNYQTHSARF